MGIGASLLSDMDKSTGFEATLSAGYHFNEHWEVGLGIGYLYRKKSWYTGTDFDNLKNHEKGFTVAPYVTYYWKIAEGFYFDLRGMLACRLSRYNRMNMDLFSTPVEVNETLFTIAASPGLTYVITEHMQVEMSLGGVSWGMGKIRRTASSGESSQVKSLSLDWNNGLSLGVGFRF